MTDANNMDSKRDQIKVLLVNSKLIADSPYSVEQWKAIIKVIPKDYLDELYGYLVLESKKLD
ncbi:hypothetical protein COV81_01785 [Candidatus Peregrinibacteria bacterium CG11_big_fil_rev_8_21_14_0_20_41_10]|nr:MAG: hypothetical protein COV81_01785 [Candidatus Peregrinibacteria bacterium CG11_big_fil_rev_8_21_14_0_20_41_10]PIZ76634.1 MAG: hypothetical protein COY06_01630 [Candidatus Peregrinibacteria bacterium CG_4_10_14_0_2_um_filter_41_8]PJC37600.1 MAG: hypothetical protein CO045_04785 [Candidatus Peregrinibacteria bacterium CG_4_9_14_0_2_um_filter_41_14]